MKTVREQKRKALQSQWTNKRAEEISATVTIKIVTAEEISATDFSVLFNLSLFFFLLLTSSVFLLFLHLIFTSSFPYVSVTPLPIFLSPFLSSLALLFPYLSVFLLFNANFLNTFLSKYPSSESKTCSIPFSMTTEFLSRSAVEHGYNVMNGTEYFV
jgi:hypothetical protein